MAVNMKGIVGLPAASVVKTMLHKAEWNEEAHPRGEGGRFGGGAKGASDLANKLSDEARAAGTKEAHEAARVAHLQARDVHWAEARRNLDLQSHHEQMGDRHAELAGEHLRAAQGKPLAPPPAPAATSPALLEHLARPKFITDENHKIRSEHDKYGNTHVKDATTGEHLGTVRSRYDINHGNVSTFEGAYGTRRSLTDEARSTAVAHHEAMRRKF